MKSLEKDCLLVCLVHSLSDQSLKRKDAKQKEQAMRLLTENAVRNEATFNSLCLCEFTSLRKNEHVYCLLSAGQSDILLRS